MVIFKTLTGHTHQETISGPAIIWKITLEIYHSISWSKNLNLLDYPHSNTERAKKLLMSGWTRDHRSFNLQTSG